MSEEFIQRHEYLEILMQDCIDCLEQYPLDYSPVRPDQWQEEDIDEEMDFQESNRRDDSLTPEFEEVDQENEVTNIISSLKKMGEMSSPKINEEELQSRLKTIISDWPQEMLPLFIQFSRIVSSAMLEIAHYHPELYLEIASRRIEAGPGDDLMAKLMAVAAGLSMPDQDPFSEPIPFRETLALLLGPKAPDWLFKPVRGDVGKLQPHEVSRVNWIRLNSIKQQVNVELELKQIMQREPLDAKVVVAAAWAMVAMAAFMNPRIFYTEADGYISSLSDSNITISTGNNQDILNFNPQSMILVAKFLKKALSDEQLGANDIMWIAAGLAKEAGISTKFNRLLPPVPPKNFALFLSHRGKDAKKQLLEQVVGQNLQEHVFLDCLSLPYRIINRNFVFRNLVQSNRVLIVRTKNYNESNWCRKEYSAAKILSDLGVCELVNVDTVDMAVHEINNIAPTQTRGAPEDTAGKGEEDGMDTKDRSWTTSRILRDIDYHGRQPNLYSAKENGLPVSYFAPMLDWLKKVNEPGYDRTAIEETTIAQKISAMYQAFFMQFGSDRSDRNETLQAWLNAPFDLWCVANHLAVAAFSLKAQGYSKMAVRYRMDICNTMTACILKSLRQFSYEDLPEKCPLNSMLLMAAAVALELAGESIDRLPEANGIKILMKDVAIVQKGLLLIDTRVMDPDDTFLLNKVVTQLIKNDIGSVGILQNADAPVHESVVDGFSLDVLPCVTLHPGMDYFFEQMG